MIPSEVYQIAGAIVLIVGFFFVIKMAMKDIQESTDSDYNWDN